MSEQLELGLRSMDACPWCGEESTVELLYVWEDTREFDVQYCCLPMREWFESCEWEEYTREDWRDFFAGFGIEARRAIEHENGFVIDYGLHLAPISQAEARAFIRTHHRHNQPPAGWKLGQAIYNGSELVGVVWAGRPVSQGLQRRGFAEVNRVCVAVTDPPGLTWNACSMLYGYACRGLRELGYRRAVTYTLPEEPGTSLRAAGFTLDGHTTGGSWHRASRPRTDKASTCRKARWVKEL